MAQNDQDPLIKELAEKIHQFLQQQIQSNSSLSDAAKESLTVASECIEQAYSIQRKPPSLALVDIYRMHKRTASMSGSNMQDPSQLLATLASGMFSHLGGGLMGQATGQPDQGTEQPQQRQQAPPATATAQADATTESQQTTRPRERKTVTESEKMAAESHKNMGNDCMKQDKFKEAYDYYTQAIQIDNNNAIYYSNRAAALSKMGDHNGALRDCREAIEIDPTYGKAYGRMGLAYASLENHLDAKKAYVKAVELDPTNESYLNNLNIAEAKLAEQQNAASGAGGASPGANVMGMLRSMMSNPQMMTMAMQSLQDPRIQGMFGLGGNPPAGGNQATEGQQPRAEAQSDAENQQNNATSASPNQQANNPQSAPGQQQQSANQAAPDSQQVPIFNTADLLNLTSRIAGNANIDFVGAGQQLLSSIQENNPQLVDNMRRMMSQIYPNNPDGNDRDQQDGNPPPGYS